MGSEEALRVDNESVSVNEREPSPERETHDEEAGVAISPQQQKLTRSTQSALGLYRELAVGKSRLPFLIKYEIIHGLFSGLPGLPGLGLRSILYPGLLKCCGKRPAIERGVSLRNPRAISFGSKVVIDESVCLHAGLESQITFGDYVSIGRYTAVVAKEGDIKLESGANIGSFCRIATQSGIRIGESTLVGAYTYIGPGNHVIDSSDPTPMIARGMEKLGGVDIGANVWIGAKATVLDGVKIGDGAVIGAHSLVREDVPPNTIVAGTPARVIRKIEE